MHARYAKRRPARAKNVCTLTERKRRAGPSAESTKKSAPRGFSTLSVTARNDGLVIVEGQTAADGLEQEM